MHLLLVITVLYNIREAGDIGLGNYADTQSFLIEFRLVGFNHKCPNLTINNCNLPKGLLCLSKLEMYNHCVTSYDP